MVAHNIFIDRDIAGRAADHKAAEADKPVAAHRVLPDTVEPLAAHKVMLDIGELPVAHRVTLEQDKLVGLQGADKPVAAHRVLPLDIGEPLTADRKARRTGAAHSLSLPEQDSPVALVVPADQKPEEHHSHNSPESWPAAP